MKHIFICYSRYDMDFVNALCKNIETSTQLAIWVDRQKLRAGDDWRSEIDHAINNALSLIVVMTPEAKASEYVTYEWAFALGVGVRVIPLLLKPTNLHPRLDSLHYLDFTNVSRPWDELMQVLEEVKEKDRFIDRELQPDSQPYPPNIQNLLDLLESVDPAQRNEALEKLTQVDHPLVNTLLLNALDHPARDVRAKATEKLSIFGIAATKNLLTSLRDPSIEVREAAVKTIGLVGYTESGLLGLLDALQGESRISQAAIESLVKMGKVAIPGLLEIIKGDNPEGHSAACDALVKLGTDAVPGLIELLRETDIPEAKQTTIEVLEKIGSVEIVPDLINALSDQDSAVRRSAVKALGVVGSTEVVPNLLKALNDETDSYSLQYEAIIALGKFGDPSVIPNIVPYLGEEKRVGYLTFGRGITSVVENFGSTAMPFLIDALEDGNSEARYNIADIMGNIGDETAIPSLINLLSDEGEKRWPFGNIDYVYSAAKTALEKIGTPEAFAAVRKHNRSRSEDKKQ